MSAAQNVVSLHERRERIKLDCAPQFYPPVLLPAGDHELGYVGHRVQTQYGRGVLAVYFVVLEFGPKEPVVVARYYPVRREKNGLWRPPKHGAAVNEFRNLFPHRRLPRLDRFPVGWLAERNVVGRIGTVETNYEQSELGDRSYSVVRELVRCC